MTTKSKADGLCEQSGNLRPRRHPRGPAGTPPCSAGPHLSPVKETVPLSFWFITLAFVVAVLA